MKKSNAAMLAFVSAFSMASPVLHAAEMSPVHCAGINSCKGLSQCKTASSACAGQNSCKGQGWLPAASAQECMNKGGSVTK